MNRAVVSLIRGYSDLSGYDLVIGRNQKIQTFINQRFDKNYPLVIFHEGNIFKNHQDYIRDHSNGADIDFVDISSAWDLSIGGYQAMCRFNSYDIWNFCKHYESILRIDDDCYITECQHDPFDQLGSQVFLRSIYWREDHGPTNQTLPHYMAQVTGSTPHEFYNHRFPYTNVFASNVKFWLQPMINNPLKIISTSPYQAQWRWGDLPILGGLLNIYAPNQVGRLDGLIYDHISHKTLVNCSQDKMEWY